MYFWSCYLLGGSRDETQRAPGELCTRAVTYRWEHVACQKIDWFLTLDCRSLFVFFRTAAGRIGTCMRMSECVSAQTPTCQAARPLEGRGGVELVGDLVLVRSVVSCQSLGRQSGIAPYAWTHLQRDSFCGFFRILQIDWFVIRNRWKITMFWQLNV